MILQLGALLVRRGIYLEAFPGWVILQVYQQMPPISTTTFPTGFRPVGHADDISEPCPGVGAVGRVELSQVHSKGLAYL